ncbi:nucleotidyltransferase domain-containing protein [bacterium]|nr:nucleotidyltransferase domain-containing protein [bacterium]
MFGAHIGLFKDIFYILHELAQFPMVEQAVLYGSRAKGNYKPGSDIDLTFFRIFIKSEGFVNGIFLPNIQQLQLGRIDATPMVNFQVKCQLDLVLMA